MERNATKVNGGDILSHMIGIFSPKPITFLAKKSFKIKERENAERMLRSTRKRLQDYYVKYVYMYLCANIQFDGSIQIFGSESLHLQTPIRWSIREPVSPSPNISVSVNIYARFIIEVHDIE